MARAIEAGGDRGEIGHVDLVEAEAVHIGACQIRCVPRLNRLAGHHDDGLVQRPLTAARVHGPIGQQIEYPDYLQTPLPTAPILARLHARASL
jgi:hypothetical protein